LKKRRFFRRKSSRAPKENFLVLPQDGFEGEDEEEDEGAEPLPELSLLEQANQCLEAFPPQTGQARELLERALEAEPESFEALDTLGVLLSEEGEAEKAREVLLRSAKLRPEAGAEKFLYLAQLSAGAEALGHFTRGASILKAEFEALKVAAEAAGAERSTGTSSSSSSTGPPPAAEATAAKASVERRLAPLRQQFAGVQASIAELYMTELGDEADAEDKCEAALAEGLAMHASSLELLTSMVAHRKIQGCADDAKAAALAAVAAVKSAIEAAEAESDEDDDDLMRPCVELPDEEAVAGLCRHLIDLEQTSEARELLVGLLERDEEDLRAWVLLGWCHVVEKDPETAKDCVRHGLRLVKQHGGESDDFKPELQKLLKKAQATAAAPKPLEAIEEENE